MAGVALGVAVVVSMDLAIQSSREAFRISTETVAGRATHQVLGGPSGVPDSMVARLRLESGIDGVAPAVEGWVSSPLLPGRPLRMLGVDPFAEAPFRPWLAGGREGAIDARRLLTTPGGLFLGRETASALGVGEDDPVPVDAGGARSELRVVGVLDAEDRWSRLGLRDLLVVDVSEAQDRLGREGRLDRIDLIVRNDLEVEAGLRDLLPSGVRLERAGTRGEVMQDMIRAFDLNLTALSLLAMIFGVFLIYNAMTFSVVQRRATLGTLRALGVTRRRMVGGVLGEAALVGVVGSGLGLVAGVALGRGLLRLVTRTINDLYFVVSVEGIALSGEVLVRGGVLGVLATLLAALPPAWEAGRVSPREAMGRSWVEEGARKGASRAAWTGVVLLVMGAGLLFVVPVGAGAGDGVGIAFVGLFGIVLGMGALVPMATVALVGVLRPAARRMAGVVGAMAARGVVTSLSRTGPAMAALVIAISVTVGLGIMIQSFRGSVARWLDTTLQADLYVSSPSAVAARPGGPLPDGLADAVRQLSGVAGVGTSRGVELTSPGGVIRLAAVELAPGGERGIDLLEASGPRPAVLGDFREGRGVFVSEPYAFRQGVSPGESVRLMAEAGPLMLPVLGVYRDYGSEVGTVMLARSLYDVHWTDTRVNALSIFLAPGADGDAIAERVRRAAGGGQPVTVRSNRELRERSLEVFDRTFHITRVLRLLAFVVAFIAVLSALMALQLERTRELGVLRANGMTPGQVGGLVSVETGIMGLVAGVLAIPVGIVLALVMVHVVNRRSFGWTLDLSLSPDLFVQAVLLALVGALVAGVYPSWRMSRTRPAEAIRGAAGGGRFPVVILLLFPLVILGLTGACRGEESRTEIRASLSPVQVLAGSDTVGYARATGPREFVFPADHGPHPEYRTEWWYLTGNLTASDGRRFGYQLTFFRNALAPRVVERRSDWSTNQLWMAHLAVTDVAEERHHAAERLARGAAGLAGARASPFRVWLDGWELAWTGEPPPTGNRLETEAGPRAEGRAESAGMFPLRAVAAEEGWGLDLTVAAGKPVVFPGRDGWSRKGPELGNASYYYSYTRLPTRGVVDLDGERYHVRGTSWMDREWSTSALGDAHVGWDWFSLQLDDGRELMFFQLRRLDGSPEPLSHGIWVEPDGRSRSLAIDDWELQVLDHWASPVDGTRLPSGWRVRVPAEGVELEVWPLMRDQEMNLSLRYWEGTVEATGRGPDGPVRGVGFVELTGYGEIDGGGRSSGGLP